MGYSQQAAERAYQATRKNLIINGNMEVWQRGTTFTSASGFNADRFYYSDGSSAAVTAARSSIAIDGSKYALAVTVTTADASIGASEYEIIGYKVEGSDMLPAQFGTSNAKDITLSFWVKSDLTGTYCVAFRNNNNDRSYVAEYTVDAADTWEKKELTIPGDTTGTWAYDSSKGLGILWTLASGSTFHTTEGAWSAGNYIASSNQVNFVGTLSDAFRITQIQLEVGEHSTDFEYRPFVEELTLCQRYYCKTFDTDTTPADYVTFNGAVSGYSADSGYVKTNFVYPVEMRTVPTITTYNPGSGGTAGYWRSNSDVLSSGPNVQHTSTRQCSVAVNASMAGNYVNIHAAADAEI